MSAILFNNFSLAEAMPAVNESQNHIKYIIVKQSRPEKRDESFGYIISNEEFQTQVRGVYNSYVVCSESFSNMHFLKDINIKNNLIIIAITIITFWGYLLFLKSPYFEIVSYWSQENPLKFVLYLFLFKIIGTIWPPLTGGLVTLGAIPFIGWINAYLIDFAGSIVAGIIDYHLGKKYGVWVLNKLFDRGVVDRILKIKVRKNREIETVFLYRVILGSTILEGIYYGSGVIGVTFRNFIIASVLSHMAFGIPQFYIVNNIMSMQNLLFSGILMILGIWLLIKLKNRHFDVLK